MKKLAYFDTYWGSGWPSLEFLQPYFLAAGGKQWSFERRTADGSFVAQGVDGTDDRPEGEGRVDITMYVWGLPGMGNALLWTKWGGEKKLTYYSRGDQARILEHTRSLHGTPLSAGLFIPFDQGWCAVRQFIETEGELPTGTAWISDRDLPPNAFPEP